VIGILGFISISIPKSYNSPGGANGFDMSLALLNLIVAIFMFVSLTPIFKERVRLWWGIPYSILFVFFIISAIYLTFFQWSEYAHFNYWENRDLGSLNPIPLFELLLSANLFLAGSILIIILSLLPKLLFESGKRAGHLEQQKDSNGADFEQKIAMLSVEFENFQSVVNQERDNVELLSINLGQDINQKQTELKRLSGLIADHKVKLEVYKTITNLSSEEQQHYLDMMDKSKSKEYVIGLTLGIMSSSLVALIGWLLDSISE
jgi:hypothetical protein